MPNRQKVAGISHEAAGIHPSGLTTITQRNLLRSVATWLRTATWATHRPRGEWTDSTSRRGSPLAASLTGRCRGRPATATVRSPATVRRRRQRPRPAGRHPGRAAWRATTAPTACGPDSSPTPTRTRSIRPGHRHLTRRRSRGLGRHLRPDPHGLWDPPLIGETPGLEIGVIRPTGPTPTNAANTLSWSPSQHKDRG
jgi:hypothetical protein